METWNGWGCVTVALLVAIVLWVAFPFWLTAGLLLGVMAIMVGDIVRSLRRMVR